jgi:hypothetical protein
MLEMLKQFITDPFNSDALGEALTLIEDLKRENERLNNLLTLSSVPDHVAQGPETVAPALLKPFRVRLSMRDRRARKEAALNKVGRNLRMLDEAFYGGVDQHVHSKKRENLRQSGIRKDDGPGRLGFQAGQENERVKTEV